MLFNRLVTLVFSVKEALFKALYRDIGYVFDFEAAGLVGLGEQVATLEVQSNLSSRWVKDSVVNVKYRWADALIYSFALHKE